MEKIKIKLVGMSIKPLPKKMVMNTCLRPSNCHQ